MNPILDACILALVLSPVDPPPVEHSPELLASLQRVSHSLDITTPGRETWGQLNPEIAWVRQQYRATLDCPPSNDAERYRTDRAWDAVRFAGEWQTHLDRERLWYPGDELMMRIADESRQLQSVWACVAVLNDKTTWTVSRRQALYRLRETLGPEGYAAGWLPPPVPLWRFREVR